MCSPATKRCIATLALAMVSRSAPTRAHAMPRVQNSPHTYLGHHVVMGTVPVAVLGEIDTRTDTWVVVTLTQTGDIMRWHQRTCKVVMAPVAGVKTSLPAATIRKLPVADIRLDRGADGLWRGAWDAYWSAADLDGDGHPGVSVRVDVPLCAGEVYVTMQTHTQAQASWVGTSLLGELHVTMQQQVIGASNLCLRLGRKQQRQTFVGVFTLTPSSGAVADCDTIDEGAWPSAVQNPRSL